MSNPTRHTAVFLFLATCVLSWPSNADTLYRRDGEQAQGQLKSMTVDSVIFTTREGEKTIPKSDVMRVQLQQPRQFDEIERVDQITDPELKACVANSPAEKDYPADGAVILYQQRVFDLTTPDVVKETVRTISKVLRQRGEDTASVTILYFEDTDQPKIDYALTVTPDGRVLHLDDAALKNESIYAKFPDYRRLARLRFVGKEPRPGSILDVQYTIVRKRDAKMEPFYAEEAFQGPSPIIRKEVLVRIPTARENELDVDAYSYLLGGWKCKRSLFRISCSKPDANRCIDEKRTVEGDVVCHTWYLTTPQPGLANEPNMPPLHCFVPNITLTFKTTSEAIGAIYSNLLASLPALPEETKQKAQALAKEGGARAIYNYITRTIRTVPVPQTQFRMTPHPAGEVLKRSVGNELDKNIVYYQMLSAADIPCIFTLVRDRRQGNPLLVSSIREFGRSAVYLTNENKYVTTIGDVFSFDTVPADFQRAFALKVLPSGSETTWIPLQSPENECINTKVDATLNENGDLEMTVVYTATGNNEASFRALKDLDDEQLHIQLQQMAGTFHPAAVLKEYKKTDLADLDVIPSLTLLCSIPGYATKAGNELMLFNMPGLDYNAGEVGRPERMYPLFFAHVQQESTRVSIQLPKGYRIYAIPKNTKIKSSLIDCQARFKKRADMIEFNESYSLKSNRASKEAYPIYKQCHEMRADIARQRIILTKKK